MILSILAVMSGFERNLIRQRQMEGIAIAKVQGKFKGRAVNTKETKEKFLKKDRNQNILKYLEKKYRYSEISKKFGCSYSTINKVKNINNEFNNK